MELLENKIEDLPIEDTLLGEKRDESLQMLFATLPILIGQDLERAKALLAEETTQMEEV
jgi:hypothetical protein